MLCVIDGSSKNLLDLRRVRHFVESWNRVNDGPAVNSDASKYGYLKSITKVTNKNDS
jgi:hypothetical protein